MGQILGQYKLDKEKTFVWIFFSQLFFVYLPWPIYVLSEYGLISAFVLHIHIIS